MIPSLAASPWIPRLPRRFLRGHQSARSNMISIRPASIDARFVPVNRIPTATPAIIVSHPPSEYLPPGCHPHFGRSKQWGSSRYVPPQHWSFRSRRTHSLGGCGRSGFRSCSRDGTSTMASSSTTATPAATTEGGRQRRSGQTTRSDRRETGEEAATKGGEKRDEDAKQGMRQGGAGRLPVLRIKTPPPCGRYPCVRLSRQLRAVP